MQDLLELLLTYCTETPEQVVAYDGQSRRAALFEDNEYYRYKKNTKIKHAESKISNCCLVRAVLF